MGSIEDVFSEEEKRRMDEDWNAMTEEEREERQRKSFGCVADLAEEFRSLALVESSDSLTQALNSMKNTAFSDLGIGRTIADQAKDFPSLVSSDFDAIKGSGHVGQSIADLTASIPTSSFASKIGKMGILPVASTIDPMTEQFNRLDIAIRDATPEPIEVLEPGAWPSPSSEPKPAAELSLDDLVDSVERPPFDEMLETQRKMLARSDEHATKMVKALGEVGKTLKRMRSEQNRANRTNHKVQVWTLALVVCGILIPLVPTSIWTGVWLGFVSFWDDGLDFLRIALRKA